MPDALSATYRLQLTPRFGFREAKQLIDDLAALGVECLYLSPIFEARRASEHGYDITDPTRIRDELGGRDGLEQLLHAAREAGLCVLLDIVPNHMAAHHENPWWWDVLKHGQSSRFARVFDIDWQAGEGRVILPVLGESLEDVIARGELRIQRGSFHDPNEMCFTYFEHQFPIQPDTQPNHTSDKQHIAEILAQQAYVPQYWREGVKKINYRRFFDVNELVGVRVEDDAVFDLSHELIVQLAQSRAIHGLRVDHIDGLRTPQTYLDRLDVAISRTPPADRSSLNAIYVEKILAPDETLNPRWVTTGTTGYEYLNRLNALFVNPNGFARIQEHAREIECAPGSFHACQRISKNEALEHIFQPEINRLTGMLHDLVDHEHAHDALRRALVAFVTALDVYRSYVMDETNRQDNLLRIDRAHRTAHEQCVDDDSEIGRALEALAGLLRSVCDPQQRAGNEQRITFASRLEQLSGAAMAKGHEDTALYRYISLTSLNEVGGEPVLAPDPVSDLHHLNTQRAADWPAALNTTATHDTKRGEDTRMRINVLSELADEWTSALDRWHDWHAPLREHTSAGPAPSRAHEVLFYQSLLGIRPTMDDSLESLAQRLGDYLVKSAREGKQQSNWYAINEAYEHALRSFSENVLLNDAGEAFRNDAQSLIEKTSFFGAIYSLAQSAVKIMSPGVPDFYQGTEFWDLVLVDPDNRRPVEFDRRRAMLRELTNVDFHSTDRIWQLLENWRDGAIKMFVIHRLLSLRKALPELFARGDYKPLAFHGEHSDCVFGFARYLGDAWVITVAPRRVAHLTEPGTFPMGMSVWNDTAVGVPDDCPGQLKDCFTNRVINADENHIVPIGSLFTTLPIAVLTGECVGLSA